MVARRLAFEPVTPRDVILDALARLSAALDEADRRIQAPSPPPAEGPEEPPVRTVHAVRPP